MKRRTFIQQATLILGLIGFSALPFWLSRIMYPKVLASVHTRIALPGALANREKFLEACIGCGLCGEVCPPNCIKFHSIEGGVAANTLIRTQLTDMASEQGFAFLAPPLSLCTDNAAMIAWAGIEQMSLPDFDPHAEIIARPRWPLDKTAKPMLGSGKKGAKA